MGSADRYCLRWDDFGANLCSAFRSLRSQEPFFDILLASEDGQWMRGAHRVLLAAISPLFQTMLMSTNKACEKLGIGGFHQVVYLRGISAQNLSHVIDFVYEGEVNVAQEDLDSFLAAAEDLQIKGLTQGEQNSRRQQPNKHPQQSTSAPTARPEVRKGAKRSADSDISGPQVTKVKPTFSLSPPLPQATKLEEANDEDEILDVTPVKFQSVGSSSGATATASAPASFSPLSGEADGANDNFKNEKAQESYYPKEEDEPNFEEEVDDDQFLSSDMKGEKITAL